jgi:hypothetical protein
VCAGTNVGSVIIDLMHVADGGSGTEHMNSN